jgi:hypothetical protein
MPRVPRFKVAAAAALTGLLVVGRPATALAQFPQWSTFPLPYVDARLVPPGQLQIGFLPSYAHYDTRYDSTGALEPLGRYFSPDSAGVGFFATLAPAEAAVRDITGDSTYHLNVGKVDLPLDVDVRRFPFDFSLGLTRWLTLRVSVPIVKTRVQGVLRIDSSGANAGLNRAGQLGPAMQLQLSQLQDAITSVQGQIAAGAYGCPTSADCAAFTTLVARAQRLHDDLAALAGLAAGASVLPPGAPLASSAAGQAIERQLAAVVDSLALAGAGTVDSVFPLPAAGLDSAGVRTIMTPQSGFGYDMLPLATARRIYTLGDMEATLRLGLLQGASLRTVLTAGVRLPTGTTAQSLVHAFTLGTGDRQMDVNGGLEFAWEPGRLGLSGTAIYTHQLSGQREMRWATATEPVVPSAFEYATSFTLGDVLQAAVYPSLTLTPGIRVYGSAYYYHKGLDRYALAGGASLAPGSPTAADMAAGSGGQALMLGGGLAYRAVSVHRDSTAAPSLPVEAGLSYQTTFSGSGGLVPKSTILSIYLRFYARLWGKRPAPVAPTTTQSP